MSERATITVAASGTASAPPDNTRIRLVSFADDPAPGDALTSCSLLTERVLSALREAGIAPADLETTSIDLNQRHVGGQEEMVTYRASNSLVVTVRPPEAAGRVIASAVDAAGTGIVVNNVNFDIEDRASLASLARREAVARAFGAARELAEAAGVALGPLVELAEVLGQWPPSRSQHLRRAAAMVPLSSPPVELGDLSVVVTVTAVFEVGPTAS